MNIVLTGSLGNISKPLAIKLVAEGHSVTVISSNSGKQKQIESLGANAAIGKLENSDFVSASFSGADAVYCMIPMSYTEKDPIALQLINKSFLSAEMKEKYVEVLEKRYGAIFNPSLRV